MNPNSWRRVLDGTAIRQGEESSALDAKSQSPQADDDGAQYLARLKTLERSAGPSPGSAVPQTGGNQPSDSFQERRRCPRYKCQGSVEFRLANSDVRTWGTLTDISEQGCYVEMMATSPVGSVVNMVVEVNGIRAQVRGEVRACYPCLGMGILFTGVEPQERQHLEALVGTLSRGSPTTAEAEATTAPAVAEPEMPIAVIADPGAALDAIVRFFQTKSVLTRHNFFDLIRRSQSKQ
jgi:PilZ domain